nr:MAG TPA: hypothetical protein [Caudoviricetes sp.]
MVAYEDQRPTRPADTLRELVQRLRTPASTPHGVKVAGPSEATLYADNTGRVHRWDGDTIGDFDTRISEAAKVVESARGTISKAEEALTQSEERIKAVEAATTPEKITDTAVAGIKNKAVAGPVFDGRSLIVPGTIDARQLNVTEQLAAQVVRAMSAEVKRLVVTEDAVLQRATVIEGIVTPELVAQRVRVDDIAAKMITSGALQTDRAARRGVKISSDGIAAFNAAGEQTVKIDASGTENYFVGTFSTAARNKAGLTAYSTPARGVTGSMASVIEMRPLDADQKAPNGVIRMDPQGALHIGMRAAGAPEYEMRGLYVDINGGVNISDSLRVLTNMRLEGRFSRTNSYFYTSVGPQNLPVRGWIEIKINFTDQGQIPFITAQPITNFAVTANIRNRTSSSCSLFLHNLDTSPASDIWVELLFHPLNRN